jgi:hypothetical protein
MFASASNAASNSGPEDGPDGLIAPFPGHMSVKAFSDQVHQIQAATHAKIDNLDNRLSIMMNDIRNEFQRITAMFSGQAPPA